MLKKGVAILLVTVLLAMPLSVSSATMHVANTHVGVAELQEAIDRISQATEKIKELGDSAAKVSSAFQDFMSVVGYASTALTAINGSVNFMKLIGVMDDPVTSGIESILDQLTTVSEKMAEMDQKLDNIANSMTTMQASAEFYNRGQKAQALRKSWNDFQLHYMEEKMDSFMTEYNAMILNGIKNWCKNETAGARTQGGIDNSRIIVLYLKNEDNVEQPHFFRENEIPAERLTGNRYVILESDCLPDTFSFNVNDYHEKLTEKIAEKMLTALNEKNYGAFSSQGFPMFTPEGSAQIDEEEIKKIAADAVNVLVYRIGCVEINRDAEFALSVNQWFNNYCTHLFSVEEGIDAMLKSFYLTHAFEYEIKEDLQDFLNRMMLKTGTYGTFVMNVEGMSDTTLDSTKLNTCDGFCKAIDNLQSSLERCVTGNNRYSYITNTDIQYSSCMVESQATISTKRVYNDTTTYQSFHADPIAVSTHVGPKNFTYLGDVNTLLLISTLQNNGVSEPLHGYFSKHITPTAIADYGQILTSYGTEQDLPLDGSVQMKVHNVLGDDFSGKSTFLLTNNSKDYPDDAAPKYIIHRKKLCGSVYNTATHKLSTDSVLLSIAVYGQNHAYWFDDEAAFFAGPSNNPKFYSEANCHQDSKFLYTDSLYTYNRFNVLLSVPLEAKLYGDSRYDPLRAYRILSEELKPQPPAEQEDPVSPATGDRQIPFAFTVLTDSCMLGIFCIYKISRKHRS